MMKLITVVGARPQFIKAATVARVLRDYPDVDERIVHTGQHHDSNMSDIFFDELDIPRPAHNLGIAGGPHGQQTGRMLEAIEKVLLAERPDGVLVYGDTNSTLAAALAAAKLHIPVAHIEAGLRSFNRRMPEEINRVLTDHTSQVLFAPTVASQANLAAEGIPSSQVHLVGDVMFDAALFYARASGELQEKLLERAGVDPRQYILATVHRAENTDDIARLTAIVAALEAVSIDVPVVLPVHPRTRGAMAAAGLNPSRIRLIDPLGYLEMLALERSAQLIVTDSGGVQKEAFFHGVQCVTLRDETEWVELVEAGWNRIVPPTSSKAVEDGVRAALRDDASQEVVGLYGGGAAADRIATVVSELF
jgi:UDP-GlcNAc3NAcA epimerase